MSTVTVIKRNTWSIWKDVIFALFARELRTGFNDKFGLSWAVINPVVFIFVLSFIREIINGKLTHTLPTFTFMAIGILFIQSFLKTFGACTLAVTKNKALFAFRQVQPISAVIAATLFQFLVKIFSLIGILIVMYFFGLDIVITDGLLFITCFCLLLLFASSLGVLFGIAELYIEEIGKIRELMTRPLFFISATFFSLQDIPREFWPYLTWNPILHAIELSRYAVAPTYGDAGVSLLFLVGTVLCTVFVSLSVYFVLWKQAISR
jgi:capsular polysaccharide transport system permease protein